MSAAQWWALWLSAAQPHAVLDREVDDLCQSNC